MTDRILHFHQRSGGFALIAVLGLLMLLSLVAAFISNYAEQRLEQTYQLQEQLQSQLDRDATLATLLHVIATRPLMQNAYLLRNPQGQARNGFDPFSNSPATLQLSDYPHLLVEGARYRGVGNSVFSMQDEVATQFAGARQAALDALLCPAWTQPATGRALSRSTAGLHRQRRHAPPKRRHLWRLPA